GPSRDRPHGSPEPTPPRSTRSDSAVDALLFCRSACSQVPQDSDLRPVPAGRIQCYCFSLQPQSGGDLMIRRAVQMWLKLSAIGASALFCAVLLISGPASAAPTTGGSTYGPATAPAT